MKSVQKLVLLPALVTSIVVASTGIAYAATSQYQLKGSAPTGTKIASVDATSSIPFDKQYYEFSANEREAFRSRFDQISKHDIPPFPRHGMQSIYKPILAEHKKTAKSGKLSVIATVDKTGRVTQLSVVESPNKRLAKVSAEVLRDTKFSPAFCDGEPCQMTFPVELTFQ
jgi:outer membrane biosynthesis protein TonB